MIDKLRLKRILAADVKILETEDLANRSIKLFNLSEETVHYVRTAASSLVTYEKEYIDTKVRCLNLPAGYIILLLSTYHHNKNIEFFIRAAAEIERTDKENDVRFILSLPHEEDDIKRIISLAKKLDVKHRIINIGHEPYEGCAEIYRVCDVVILPSMLESFSNAFIERTDLQMTDNDIIVGHDGRFDLI